MKTSELMGFVVIGIIALAVFVACDTPLGTNSTPDMGKGSGDPNPVAGDPLELEDEATGIVLSEDFIWVDMENGPQNIEFLELDEAVDYINENAADNSNFTVRVGGDRTIKNLKLYYDGKKVNITFVSNDSTEKRIQVGDWGGTLVEVGVGTTLTLDRGITIVDSADYYWTCIVSSVKGKLVMREGSKIIKENENGSGWIGVRVEPTGEFIHEGAIIGDRQSCTGVMNFGQFTMNKGSIINCYGDSFSSRGSGVVVYSGGFTMNGGLISDNMSEQGGGVFVGLDGEFTLNGGTISQNWAVLGGGVYVQATDFIMTGGDIINNENGAVWLGWGGGKFTMDGGTISGSSGGQSAVYILAATFVKNGGTISNNGTAVIASMDNSGSGIMMHRTNTAGPDVKLVFNYTGSPIADGAWDEFSMYTVTFDPVGGHWDDGLTVNKSVTTGMDYIITPLTPPKHDRRQFAGWYTKPAGGFDSEGTWSHQHPDGTNTFTYPNGGEVFDFTVPLTKDTTVYAHWQFQLPLTHPDDIIDYIKSQHEYLNEHQPPMGVYLPLKIDMGDMSQPTSDWCKLLESILWSRPKVNLDLSASTMSGTEFNPGNLGLTFFYPPDGDAFNTLSPRLWSDAWDRITAIVLPDTAESLSGNWYKGGTISDSSLRSFCAKNLKYIPAYAFSGGFFDGGSRCTSIEQLELPAVVAIGRYAFQNCQNLKVIVLGETPPTLELIGSEIHNTHPNLEIRVPSTSIEAYKSTVDWRWVADRIVGY